MAYAPSETATLIALPEDAPIQLFDLKTQQASIRPALEQRWIDILDHGRFIGGPEVTECEEKLAECRARFVEKTLIDAGVAPARLKLLTKGAIGSGEAYRHRKVTVSLD